MNIYLNIKEYIINIMSDLSGNEINGILISDKFLNNYNEYIKNIDVDKLRNFFDDIETNRNYFRLNIKKSKRFTNKNNDTLTIKNINSNINKCTETNIDQILKLIVDDIKKNEHLINLIIENLLEKCISHHIYIHIYINIINEINKNNNVIRILNNTLNKYYDIIFNHNYVKSGNIYENLCNENKKTDNMIGYLMLITYLDKDDIIKERIDGLLQNIFTDILEKDNDEIFKLLNCIQNICKISKEYIINYIEIIKQLKDRKYNSKVRCKVMDIEDMV